MCQHQTDTQDSCPSAEAVDREAAHVIGGDPLAGWSLLCNGVLLFADTGELLPDGRVIAPHRGSAVHALAS